MIVPMKKVSFVLLESEKDTALSELRKAGVVHLDMEKRTNDTTAKITADRERVFNAIVILENIKPGKGKKADGSRKKGDDSGDIAGRVLALNKRKEEIFNRLLELNETEKKLAETGGVSRKEISELAESGFFMNFYKVNRTRKQEIGEKYGFITVSETKNDCLIGVFSDGPIEVSEAEPVVFPEINATELKEERIRLQAEDVSVKGDLEKLVHDLPVLNREFLLIEQELKMEEARAGVDAEEKLVYFSGFIPVKKTELVKDLAEKQGWGLLIDDPSEGDNVPTLIKNRGPIKIIQPIFQFLGTIPGYGEYDISFYFLLFFSVFFAMIVGDGGYGLVFLVLAVLGHIALAKKKKPLKAIALLYVLSLCTVAWGAVTGNWFGSKTIGSIPFLKQLVIPEIAAFPELFPGTEADSNTRIMFLCFILGVVQLSIACVKKVIRDFPFIRFMGHFGWLAMVIGLYFIVLQLVLGRPSPDFILYVIIGGFAAVVLFDKQEKGVNFFKGILRGIGGLFTTFLDSIGTFSNIISYIRLFAVGMAGLAIATSFNDIASPMLSNKFLVAAGVLVLLLGHGLNLVMALLSVVVHGIRLNMLEFSGQLGMEWSGIKYEPFKVYDDKD